MMKKGKYILCHRRKTATEVCTVNDTGGFLRNKTHTAGYLQ